MIHLNRVIVLTDALRAFEKDTAPATAEAAIEKWTRAGRPFIAAAIEEERKRYDLAAYLSKEMLDATCVEVAGRLRALTAIRLARALLAECTTPTHEDGPL